LGGAAPVTPEEGGKLVMDEEKTATFAPSRKKQKEIKRKSMFARGRGRVRVREGTDRNQQGRGEGGNLWRTFVTCILR